MDRVIKLKPLLLVSLGLICTATFYFTLSLIEDQKTPLAPVRWIAQTGPIKEALSSDYFAEILDLSVESLEPIDLEGAQNILKEHPLLNEVTVNTLDPETLYIDYTLRQPCFFLADFSNMASDTQGNLFPITPFLTPKHLPHLFLGVKSAVTWQETIPEDTLQLALKLISYFEERCELKWIDLSQLYADSLGEREIVLIVVPETEKSHYLRLTPKDYEKELSYYFKISERIKGESFVIDLRAPDLAYLARLTYECDPSTL